MTIIPVAIVAGVWYHLAKQGLTTQTIWLGCNVFDSLRALRLIRPNGLAVGQRTRRKAVQQALVCWMTFITIQCIGSLPDKLLSWLPVYSLLRTIVVSCFLLARVSASETIYISAIQPLLQKYETPIELTAELVGSLVMLVYHFTLEYPLDCLRLALAPHTAKVATVLSSFKRPVEATASGPDADKIEAVFEEEATSNIGTKIAPGPAERLSVQEILETAKRICDKQSPVRPGKSAEGMSRPLPRSVTRLRSTLSSAGPSKPRAARPRPADTVFQDPFTDMPPTKVARTDSIALRTKPTVARSRAPPPPSRRPAPVDRSANLPTAHPPLVKAKSASELKPKPLVAPEDAKRAFKSAPTRRLAAKVPVAEESNTPKRKSTSAAERSKEMRERKRREQGVQPGEKRRPPPLNLADTPGSKRTKFTVAKD